MRKFMTVSIATLATIGAMAVQAPAAHAAPKVTRINSGTGKVLRVVMYADVEGGGDRLEYWGSGNCTSSTTDVDFSKSTIPAEWNDRISSWKDYAQCDVQFFMDSNFGGRYTYFLDAGSSKPRNFGPTWNDKVSSFKVS
jgi:hypothetical protein